MEGSFSNVLNTLERSNVPTRKRFTDIHKYSQLHAAWNWWRVGSSDASIPTFGSGFWSYSHLPNLLDFTKCPGLPTMSRNFGIFLRHCKSFAFIREVHNLQWTWRTRKFRYLNCLMNSIRSNYTTCKALMVCFTYERIGLGFQGHRLPSFPRCPSVPQANDNAHLPRCRRVKQKNAPSRCQRKINNNLCRCVYIYIYVLVCYS